MSPRLPALLFVLPLLGLAADTSPPTAAQLEFFEKEVRPVLAEQCFSCHGPKKQKSGLRLDSREFVLKGGEVGPVVVPGNPAASRLILSVNHVKQKDVEPMPGEGEKLAPAQIAALAEWVKQGLPWPAEAGPAIADPRKHWAFQPVVAPPTPTVRADDRLRAPLDAFVLAKLESAGLTLSPEAPREVLARRLYLTLWGLAPTAAEIEAFVADRDPQAVEKLVDRLLAAPAFGERWGRHWLDVARYSDTKGYVFEEERRYAYAYTYRDWVIAAFNRDLPYDRFLKLQLAADLYASGEDNRDLAALGFLTLGRRFLNNQNDIIDDRIDVVMRGMQGLTMACARCHDHKFDPLPTTDYYSLHAIFNSSEEPKEKPLLKPFTATKETEEFEAELARLQKKGADFVTSRREGSFSATKTAAYLSLLRRSLADPKLNADQEAKRLALYPAVLGGWKKVLQPRLTPTDPLFGLWARLAGTPDDQFADALAAQLLAKSDLRVDPLLRSELTKAMPRKFDELAAAYGNVLAAARGRSAEPARRPWAELIEAPNGPTSPTAESLIGSYVTADAQGYRKLVREAEAFKATNPKSPPRAMVMVDKAKPVNGTVFLRGNPGRPGKTVPRQYLELLASGPRQPFTEGSGRRQLAEAIASPTNPLTARVMVNRVWNQVFGQPLVETPSDFGVRTAPPTNPALLEHLAARFVADGWSMKRLIRSMVLSATFRQSSALTDAGLAKDPDNRLNWRMNRRRLDFEAMRDSMLRSAGNLEGKAAGQPFDLIADFTTPRRTVFGFIDRQNLPAVFRTFDFANPDYHVAKRNQTTTPQQALWMINHPFGRALSDNLATRTAAVAKTDERVQALYRATLGRAASATEVTLATEFLRDFGTTPAPAGWKNGIGGWDAARKVVQFTEMKTRVDDRIAPQARIPDPVNGHAFLTAKGGHPGNDAQHAVIRRWQAGAAAQARVEGDLKVPSKASQGVRARIVSDRRGLLGEWIIKGGETTAVTLAAMELTPGETLDFIVDDLNGPNSDGFSWAPALKDAKTGETIAAAGPEFGKTATPQSAWSALAQVLLESNEFNFVD
jgi:mono/diheme cytochrome c family protein